MSCGMMGTMNFEPRPEDLDAVLAANRIARRAELLRAATGRSKWRLGAVCLYLLGVGGVIYIAWTWTYPWSIAALFVFLFMQTQVQVLESEMSRRLDAIVALLEDLETRVEKERKRKGVESDQP
jgi:hypothetical protein